MSVAACAVRLRGQSPEAIYDRAYRLNYNLRMNLIDRGSFSAAVGLFIISFGVGHPCAFRPHYGHVMPTPTLSRRFAVGSMSGLLGFGVGAIIAEASLHNQFAGHKIREALKQETRSAAAEHVVQVKQRYVLPDDESWKR